MGRFTTTIPSNVIENSDTPNTFIPYSCPSNYGNSNQFTQNAYNTQQQNWPTVFTKPIIGIEREGVFIENNNLTLTSPSQINFIPGSLEAIKMMRLKGYKLVIIYDEPGIQKNKVSINQVDAINQYFMQIFGKSGILSIDGLLYSTSDLKGDAYAKPNIGMFNKAATEFNSGIVWKEGWFVGTELKDVVSANKIGAKPVLLQTGNGKKTLRKLESVGNRTLLNETLIFDNLLEFANSLE